VIPELSGEPLLCGSLFVFPQKKTEDRHKRSEFSGVTVFFRLFTLSIPEFIAWDACSEEHPDCVFNRAHVKIVVTS
jgi:hypothetical protein